MLLIIALQAAVAFAHPPQRLSDSARITFEDYPAKAMKRGETGIVSARLHVTADGQVDRCAVTESSRSPSLDSATCTLAQSRSRFAPARDADGKAVPGDYRLAMTWTTEPNQPRARVYGKTRVAALPPGYVQPAGLMVVFGPDGHASECEIMASSGNAQADAAVCGSVTQSLVIKAPKSASPEPAAAVRYYIMTLIAENGTDGAPRH